LMTEPAAVAASSRYPKNWRTISRSIRERAGYRCEACDVENGQPNPITGTRVALTVAHLDQQPENCDPGNLRALCQKCHGAYDAAMRRKPTRETYWASGVPGPISRQTGKPVDWLTKPRCNDAERERWIVRDHVLRRAQWMTFPLMTSKKFVRVNRELIDQRMGTVRFVVSSIRIKRKGFRGTRLRIIWLTPPESPDVWHLELPTGDGGYERSREMERAFKICERVNELQPIATTQQLTVAMMRQFVASLAAEFPRDYAPKPAECDAGESHDHTEGSARGISARMNRSRPRCPWGARKIGE
jgi:hypothetical protein